MADMADKAKLIDGKAIAAALRAELAEGAAALVAETGVRPGLAVIRVGDDPASEVYVRGKRRACEAAGFASWEHHLPAEISEDALLEQLGAVAADPAVHGILVQLPLPAHIDENRVLSAVPPEKDADGFHPISLGKLLMGEAGPRPCTPAGILHLLDQAGVELRGKRALVVGRSTIVGKPVALLLLERHATVTVAHSRTADLAARCREADVIIAAVGRPELIKGAWLKPGAVVIDVGINRLPEGGLVGDVAFNEALDVASAITPVPGGVGPMTIAMLLSNTLDAARVAARRAPK